MIRQRFLPPIPDAINCSLETEYTTIPNKFLRNPEISLKAKAILALLLSNKAGWKSYLTQLATNTKEGVDAISNAIRELEIFGYVVRLHYRDKVTKVFRGSLWAYSHHPFNFDIQNSLVLLDLHGLEIPNVNQRLRQKVSPEVGKPEAGLPTPGLYGTKKLNNKKLKTTNSSEEVEKTSSNGFITPKDFFKFWELYPSHRRDSKGKTLTMWERACTNKQHRPTWNRIERAIKKQLKSDQWQIENGKYIPLSTTWINNKRWLDGTDQLKNWSSEQQESAQVEYGDAWKEKFGFKDE